MVIIKNRLKAETDQLLPLVITPNGSAVDLVDWVEENKKAFEKDLLEHGGVLFRGFGIDTAAAFDRFIKCFDSAPLPYMFRSSPRRELDKSFKNVYLSTSYPNDRAIRMHNESSYSRVWGKKIVFCCVQPAVTGGETPIADSRRVLGRLRDPLLGKFRKLGVKYRRYLRPELGMPWQEVFQTEDIGVAKEICDRYRLNYRIDKEEFIIEWVKPAIVRHPVSGEETWFNHAFFFNKYSLYEEMGLPVDDPEGQDYLTSDTFFGDGSAITYREYLEIKEAYERNIVTFPYERGDILFLDNMLAAHGRNPYKGDRVIATALMEAEYDHS